jgi:hypothetical protein
LYLACAVTAPLFAQTPPPAPGTAPSAPLASTQAAAARIPSLEEKEQFLLNAKVVKAKSAAKGITNTLRATMSDGNITHDASIQRIDEEKQRFETDDGAVEMNFRDSYKFNIAAYRLGKMLGLDSMIPPSVDRRYDGNHGAFTWWVEDVAMDEAIRQKQKISPPDKEIFNRQYLIMQVFDNLIYNTDRNLTNILFDKEWRLWMIDHTRAFRIRTDLLNAKLLKMCDRQLLANMKKLTYEAMRPELSPYLRDTEIKAILARRDKIVALFDSKGDSALYDFLPAKR